MVVGTVLWTCIRMALWDMGYFLRNEQMHGSLESTWPCPVWRSSSMLAASLTKLATSVLFLGVTVLEFGLLLGVRLVRGNIPLLILIVLLMLPQIGRAHV